MPSADSFTLSARVPNKVADEFKKLADGLGLTPNALIKNMVESAVSGKPTDATGRPVKEQAPLPEVEGRLYGVALALVDDLIKEGYPESEISNALTSIRREML